ncbi:hypothetical protein [Chachezhania sediminis]|uniref:hypothetical protein n=1 Tax=Chachezhania sediminis TaxID=2599291 RepID=UPI00131B7F55|nr:hypothetical protein [Chachezhania sediminis]
MNRLSKSLCLLGIPLLTGTVASAQQMPGPGFSFGLAGAVMGSATVDMSSGDTFSYARSYVQAEGELRRGPASSIALVVGGGQTRYSFGSGYRGRTRIDVNELSLSMPMRFRVGERSALIFVPQVSFAAESGAGLSDGMTYGAIGGMMWRLSPTLLIGPGLGIQSSLLDKTVFFPFLLVDWEFADGWSLSTGSGFAATRGPGLRVKYDVTDTWEVGIEARYEEFEFRISDANGGGTGVDRSVPIVVTTKWSPSPALTINGFAGVASDGEFLYEDGYGNEVARSDYDPAPIFGLFAKYEF